MNTFYQLKYYVTEAFYEYIVEEGYTVGQSVDRCFVEFGKQLSGGGLDALTVYSTLFSKAALHSAESLRGFRRELQEMNRLFDMGTGSELPAEAREELADDIAEINHRLSQLEKS